MIEVLGVPFPVIMVAVPAVVSLAAGIALWWDGQRAVAPNTAARRAMRHAVLTRVVAIPLLIFGMLYPPLTFAGGDGLNLVGRVVALVPIASVLGVLMLHAIGELTWPKPGGTERRARLVRRTPGDIAPRRLRQAPVTWVAAIAATSVIFAVMASGPRSLSRVIEGDRAITVDPFPGWMWTVPILIGAGVVVAATEMLLSLIASRPAVADVDEDWDMWLRRRVARSVLRSVQLVLGLTLAGLVTLAGLALRYLGLGNGSAGPGTAPTSTGFITAGTVVLVVSLAIGVAALGIALWPARDPAPRSASPRPAGARA